MLVPSSAPYRAKQHSPHASSIRRGRITMPALSEPIETAGPASFDLETTRERIQAFELIGVTCCARGPLALLDLPANTPNGGRAGVHLGSVAR